MVADRLVQQTDWNGQAMISFEGMNIPSPRSESREKFTDPYWLNGCLRDPDNGGRAINKGNLLPTWTRSTDLLESISKDYLSRMKSLAAAGTNSTSICTYSGITHTQLRLHDHQWKSTKRWPTNDNNPLIYFIFIYSQAPEGHMKCISPLLKTVSRPCGWAEAVRCPLNCICPLSKP